MFSRARRSPASPAVMVSFGVLVALLFLPMPAAAGQAGNPASIIGVVTDTSGAVLPGVTVTATSPALQVPSVTGVSDERGVFWRLPARGYDVHSDVDRAHA